MTFVHHQPREFTSARELLQFYRELRARTSAWSSPTPAPAPMSSPPPPPAPPAPPPPPLIPLRMTPIMRIIIAVAKEFKIPPQAIRSNSRLYDVLVPRQVAILLAREMTSSSTVTIGRMLGRRDHATIWSSTNAIKLRIAHNPELARQVEHLRDTLLERHAEAGAGP